ncbi:hypothetical protein FDX19_16805 [Citrobacter sp. wls619]|uniref:hypothetical protein n=1 Tax=Citrobacter sp. wls619 TaxID=2576432 RepID=UPI0010C9ADE3|nr:hypothetical protein [Citrobacter sp. wls619]TKV07862.1 hypothetical protein FDX19_16805 [Citrobacter sp. wls619]
MTVNRSIFTSTKSKSAFLLIGGIVVGFGLVALYTLSRTPVKSKCVVPMSFYAIKAENDITLTRGVYRTYRDSLTTGHTTFNGNIREFKNDVLVGKPSPVHRSVNYKMEFSGSMLNMTVLNHTRRLGDSSSDQEVMDYVFPQLSYGESTSTTLYLLENRALASGTEIIARVVCTN